MKLYHATPLKNLVSINLAGLLCSKSKGKLPVVWLCTERKTSWALLHVVKRHGGRVQDVVIVEVSIPRSWLRRNRRKLWYCPRDIIPERFVSFISFPELASSPVEG